jgi:thioredoxin-like negative regulator of GroEL
MDPATFQYRLKEARQLLLAREFGQALARYEKLTRAFPGQAVVWFEYGNAASRTGQMETAARAWDKAITLDPHNAGLILQAGHQYRGARQPERAQTCYARAAAADAKAIDPRISLALMLEHQHRIPEARAVVEECLAISAADEQANYLLAVLDRRSNQLEQAEQRLRRLLQTEPGHPYVRYAARYELARVLDRTERYHEAMTVLADAKRIVKGLTDFQALLKVYDQTAASARASALSQPKDVLRAWAKSFPAKDRDSIPPLAFLGGHPRSGTTLLEQVLGAHPRVTALDEPQAFTEAIEPALRGKMDHSSGRLNVLRRTYTRALLRASGATAPGKLLLEKNPSLTTQLPILLRVFPELRVVIALRDPRDVVLSCYFQNILLNPTSANFLSFECLAKHYADLMDIWLAVREWEELHCLETRYEDTVADVEKQGRRVTGFLGLEWHDEQSRFYEQNRQLYSPTYQDVTQPVHGRSVGRWQHYEKHLEPIMAALEPYCAKLGYPV